MQSTEEVRELIARDEGLAGILEDVRSRIADDVDPGHDLGHLLRVAMWTLRLAEASVDRRSALAAAR